MTFFPPQPITVSIVQTHNNLVQNCGKLALVFYNKASISAFVNIKSKNISTDTNTQKHYTKFSMYTSNATHTCFILKTLILGVHRYT